MNIKVNNPSNKGLDISAQTIYGVCRLLTLAQIENVLKSDCQFVLLWIGDEINYIYCDPIPTEELAKMSVEKTNGYYLSKTKFKEEISPRLVGL